MIFQYSLQRIVDLKNNEKTQAEWLLSQALGQLRIEEASLNELYLERELQVNELASVTQKRTPISNVQLIQSYLLHLEERIADKHNDLHKAQSDVTVKKDRLTDKMVDEKIWTKAKEKAYKTFTSALLKKEQEEMDEMAAMRHGAVSELIS